MKNLNKYIGLEFENCGRGPKFDCWGLVVYFYKEELGIELPDYSELLYPQDWYSHGKNYFEVISNSYVDCIKVNNVNNLKLYDCLLFYNDRWGKIVNHIGIYIGNDKFLHITENNTSQINRFERYWKSRLYQILRYIGGK